MAKLTGILTRLRGTIGDVTFARMNGMTVAKQKLEPKGTPTRTKAQMDVRIPLRNMQNVYRALAPFLHPAFENRPARVSDYNMFCKRNYANSPVYLTKVEAGQGGAVVAPYQITEGTLPAIVVSTGMGDEPTTDINMGSLTISATTTVKEFADTVVENNPDYNYGDQIAVIIVEQYENIETHVPYIKAMYQEITLDGTDSVTKVRSLVGAGGFSIIDGNLGASSSIDGGIAWIHSRKDANGTHVSTQRLKVTNSYLANYQTPEAKDAAYKSFGGLTPDGMLTPGTNN